MDCQFRRQARKGNFLSETIQKGNSSTCRSRSLHHAPRAIEREPPPSRPTGRTPSFPNVLEGRAARALPCIHPLRARVRRRLLRHRAHELARRRRQKFFSRPYPRHAQLRQHALAAGRQSPLQPACLRTTAADLPSSPPAAGRGPPLQRACWPSASSASRQRSPCWIRAVGFLPCRRQLSHITAPQPVAAGSNSPGAQHVKRVQTGVSPVGNCGRRPEALHR
jgi:hypothetical protein